MPSVAMQPSVNPSPEVGVFISHGHADAEVAEALARVLQHRLGLQPAQITCSSTPELGLRRGADVSDEIRDRIQHARVFILLATANSAKSQWVPHECGLASSVAERSPLAFYVVTPTATDREFVPAPYAQCVGVTLSNGEDTWQFLSQLGADVDATGGDRDAAVVEMLGLQRMCAAYDAERDEACAAASKVELQAALRRASRTRLALLATAAAALLAVGGVYLWHVTTTERLAAGVAQQLEDKDRQLSAQALAFEQRRSAELAEFPFSGFIQDGRRKCASVSVRRMRPDGKPKLVTAECGADGIFVIPGEELNADPRERLPITVVVNGAPYQTIVDRSSAPVAIRLTGGE